MFRAQGHLWILFSPHISHSSARPCKISHRASRDEIVSCSGRSASSWSLGMLSHSPKFGAWLAFGQVQSTGLFLRQTREVLCLKAWGKSSIRHYRWCVGWNRWIHLMALLGSWKVQWDLGWRWSCRSCSTWRRRGPSGSCFGTTAFSAGAKVIIRLHIVEALLVNTSL